MRTINLLLVDDDTDDYELFQMALDLITEFRFNISWSKNGLEAMEHLNNQITKPDLIVMDLNMPLKNGFQTLSEIKSTKNLSHIPVHIFTTSTDHVDTCKQLGCTGYFRKPINMNGYKASIQHMLAEEYFPHLKHTLQS